MPARAADAGARADVSMDDFRLDRVGSALAGTNPTVLRRLDAGFAVIGDVQHLPGYCVLITDDPHADQPDRPAGRGAARLPRRPGPAGACGRRRLRPPGPGLPPDQPGDPGQHRRLPARPRDPALHLGAAGARRLARRAAPLGGPCRPGAARARPAARRPAVGAWSRPSTGSARTHRVDRIPTIQVMDDPRSPIRPPSRALSAQGGGRA
ncbi:hypothetical protein [Nocardioides convexus]|uniref:hypothetical protein n=1 Tax=Nocardioides convexus TaxID=2712224 RepID=UPI002418B140|nr:hypothetical protein [Nocardioides convexus]